MVNIRAVFPYQLKGSHLMLAAGKSLDIMPPLVIAVGENMMAEIGQNTGSQTGLMSQDNVLASISSIRSYPL